jgi:predicted small lipoprotein YifL
MRKIIGIVMALCMLFLIAACAADDPVTPPPEAPVTPPPVEPAAPPTQEDDDDADDVDVDEIIADELSFPGRIAIVTNEVSQNEEEFRSAAALVYRYGSDRVIHRTWPVAFAAEGEMMISILMEIASDP